MNERFGVFGISGMRCVWLLTSTQPLMIENSWIYYTALHCRYTVLCRIGPLNDATIVDPLLYYGSKLYFYVAVCIMYSVSVCGILIVWYTVCMMCTLWINVPVCGANTAPPCTTGGDTLVPPTPGGLSVTICQRAVSLRCKGRDQQKKCFLLT